MDDRSERLRRRRRQSTARSDGRADGEESSNASDSEESAEPSTPSSGSIQSRDDATPDPDSDSDAERDNGDGSTRPIPIKEQQTGTYMYLPDTQVQQLRRQYNVIKAEYEFEYGEEFEKNRHFYPLVVQYGLDRLDGLDVSEIRALLEELYE